MGHPILAPHEITWRDLHTTGVAALYGDPTLPLEVEIGPGDDDFLLTASVAAPERNWLGIEYSHKRVRRQIRRVERVAGTPPNLRWIWRPAADVVGPFLRAGNVAAFHIYFPDPWPKAHHARYRLLDAGFLTDLAAALAPQGFVHLATDSRPYAEEIVAALAAVPALANAAPAPGWWMEPPQERTTLFEQRWRTEGRTIHALRFCREATQLT